MGPKDPYLASANAHAFGLNLSLYAKLCYRHCRQIMEGFVVENQTELSETTEVTIEGIVKKASFGGTMYMDVEYANDEAAFADLKNCFSTLGELLEELLI